MPEAPRVGSEALVYDWNTSKGASPLAEPLELLDETLRDGLQSPSVRHPGLDEKIELLSCMETVGIDVAKIGIPSSSKRVFDDAVAMARFAGRKGFRLRLACAARALTEDVERVAEVASRAGRAVDVYVFVPASLLRMTAEGWDTELPRRLAASAIARARALGLAAAFVAEDATRARPETLTELVRAAIDAGATRVCLCDTAGYATPRGAAALVSFVRELVASYAGEIGIDWHGHDDRGLALANALSAAEAGAGRIHATALGVGERAGNVAMELFVMNALLAGAPAKWDPKELSRYCLAAARALNHAIPAAHPFFGEDAFRTATGTHAAAIAKAEARGDAWLADRVYGPVPASRLGRKQEIGVGAMSGTANVTHWLGRHGVGADDALVRAVLAEAKTADRTLSDDELWRVVRKHQGAQAAESEPGHEDEPPRRPAE